jgi:hypothetical protein
LAVRKTSSWRCWLGYGREMLVMAVGRCVKD